MLLSDRSITCHHFWGSFLRWRWRRLFRKTSKSQFKHFLSGKNDGKEAEERGGRRKPWEWGKENTHNNVDPSKSSLSRPLVRLRLTKPQLAGHSPHGSWARQFEHTCPAMPTCLLPALHNERLLINSHTAWLKYSAVIALWTKTVIFPSMPPNQPYHFCFLPCRQIDPTIFATYGQI